MRDQDDDHWIKQAIQAADKVEEYGNELIVIDDLRFRNEAHKLREEGWLLVRIERIDAPDPGVVGADISEIDLDDWTDWDDVIHARTGDLHTLFSAMDALIEKEE